MGIFGSGQEQAVDDSIALLIQSGVSTKYLRTLAAHIGPVRNVATYPSVAPLGHLVGSFYLLMRFLNGLYEESLPWMSHCDHSWPHLLAAVTWASPLIGLFLHSPDHKAFTVI